MTNESNATFDLEAEVRDLAAHRDIHDAVCRYMRGQDRLDPVLHRSAFHDDAWVDCGLVNGTADEFVAFAQGFPADTKGSQHFMGQAQIDVRGDRASGEVYFIASHRIVEIGEEKDLFVAGRYIDEYARKNGEWRLSKRRLITDWVRTDPADSAFIKANPTMILAGRRGTDFSQTRGWPPG